jgi:predicted RNA-binding Zn ribbon-like protein
VVSADPRYQRVVEGLLLPAEVAGHPALDFCNTRAGWYSPGPRDYLTSFDHLVVWAREAGLVEPAVARRLRRMEGGEKALAKALRLRTAIYRACTEEADDEAWDAVATEARRAAAAAILVRGRGWVIPERVGLELPVLEVARAAGALLASPELARSIGACPGNDCGWLFLDPRGRRRWCVMAVCGNREKARRHARRARA